MLIALILGFTSAFGQETESDCSQSSKLKRPKHGIISFGVVNGKARNLVKPPYPATARAVGLRGNLAVSVVIDTRGCVVEAKAVSGHPLLRHGSEKAALQSSFYPIELSSGPIWVTGTIIYRYVSDTANWLEVGYFSGDRDKLSIYLSGELADAKAELDAAANFSFTERAAATERAVERIRLSLNSKPKELWLFDVGRQLAAIKNRNWSGPGGFKDQFEKLRTLAVVPPETVKSSLPNALLELLKEHPSSDEFRKRLSAIEERLYYYGN
jgi:hypothetical protein